jgi:hypothetical protein
MGPAGHLARWVRLAPWVSLARLARQDHPVPRDRRGCQERQERQERQESRGHLGPWQ